MILRAVWKIIFSYSTILSKTASTIYSEGLLSAYVFVPLLQILYTSSSPVCCGCGSWLSFTHWAPLCSMTPHTRSDRGQQPHFPFPFRKPQPPLRQQTSSTFPECTSPAGWPQGRQLSITASAGSAASGHRLEDVREASERNPGSAYGIISVHSWRVIKLAILLLF